MNTKQLSNKINRLKFYQSLYVTEPTVKPLKSMLEPVKGSEPVVYGGLTTGRAYAHAGYERHCQKIDFSRPEVFCIIPSSLEYKAAMGMDKGLALINTGEGKSKTTAFSPAGARRRK
ncbi:MAG: hypothetical protein FWG97_05360 [Deltaproteobacteria bacterium]|nr:hypothetical protein [Deltaproteobacteria bacterium]